MGGKVRSEDAGDTIGESPLDARVSETDEISAETPLLPYGPSSDSNSPPSVTPSLSDSPRLSELVAIDVKPDSNSQEEEDGDGEASRKLPAIQGMRRDEEEGDDDNDEPQCRICLESEGDDLIAPCRCKGSAKYVHRECLDQWRSIKEGFAFAHCTTCKMRYQIQPNLPPDMRWRNLKFHFFVTRDICVVTLAVQLVIAALGASVFLIDSKLLRSRLVHDWHWHSAMTFYYVVGLLLFLVLAGMSGGILTCFDQRFRSDLGAPCRELGACCLSTTCYDCSPAGQACIFIDCTSCCDTGCMACYADVIAGCADMGPILFFIGAAVLLALAIAGLIYCLLVAVVVCQRVWQRHYHILAKRILAKEYVVEDLSGQDLSPDWIPPPLPPEHERQLRELGLLQ